MITIEENNIKALIGAMKGIAPANYESMARIVACVDYLSSLLDGAEKKAEEVTEDG